MCTTEKEMCIDEKYLKQRIYQLMSGTWNIEDYPVEESKYIKNEFEEDEYCSEAYKKIFNANRNLCKTLGKEEDIDIEIIISQAFNIAEYLSMKMFDYGVIYSKAKDIDKELFKILLSYNELDASKKELFIKLLLPLKHLCEV